jgi:hypothetical protein
MRGGSNHGDRSARISSLVAAPISDGAGGRVRALAGHARWNICADNVKGARLGGHRFFWCFGASLSRLLPVIEINKEFSDFFNDPKRERLTGWQSGIFSVIGIIGFVLGAVLVAAVSGLTQNP